MTHDTSQPARISTDRLRELQGKITAGLRLVDRDEVDIDTALDELLAARESDPCVPDPFSSRTCERGTKACNVRHGAREPAVTEAERFSWLGRVQVAIGSYVTEQLALKQATGSGNSALDAQASHDAEEVLDSILDEAVTLMRRATQQPAPAAPPASPALVAAAEALLKDADEVSVGGDAHTRYETSIGVMDDLCAALEAERRKL